MGANAAKAAAVAPAVPLTEAEIETLTRGIELARGGWFPEFADAVEKLLEANGAAVHAADKAMDYHPSSRVAMEVLAALGAARSKHAPMYSPHEGWSVILEELEELREHVRADTGRGPEARKEALQVAAMGMRYAIDLCAAPREEG